MASVKAASSRRVMPRHTNGHQPCGKLVIGNGIVRGAANEELDFLGDEFPGVSLLADDVNSAHRLESSAKASTWSEFRQRRR